VRLHACIRLWSILAIALAGGVLPARADLNNLLGRIPGESNALVVIDLEKILASPVSQREGWKERLANAYASKPLIVPPGTGRLVMAALLEPGTANVVWEVSVLDIKNAPSIESIAQAEEGYLDKVGGKPAAWSPINAYFVQLDPEVLGVVCPANRQFVARWIGQKEKGLGGFASLYLRTAAAAVGKGADVIMAVDLEDVTCAPKVLNRLETETFDSLEGKGVDPSALAELVGSLKGVTLQVKVGEEITGEGVVEFGSDTAVLKDIGKPLLLEVMSQSGLYLSDFENWDVSVAGKKLSLKGKLSSEGFRRLLSVVDPPAPNPVEAVAVAPREPKPEETEAETPVEPEKPDTAAMAEASREYFLAVMVAVDNLSESIGSGSDSASLSKSAAWLKRDARRIDRLPVLNVDPDLLAWSVEASSRLKEIANICEIGNMQTQSRTATVQSSGYYGVSRSEAAAQRRMVSGQRRQVAMEEKARAYGEAARIGQDLRGSAGKIRVVMTQRYGVEF